MISVVIPTLQAAGVLGPTLAALVPAAVEEVVREVIVVDGGSRDLTCATAEASGARLLTSPPGRGVQLAAGAEAARCEWLLFLHADTVLEEGWHREAMSHIQRQARGAAPERAAAFRFALDDEGPMPRLMERGVAWRCALLKLPYGDQGLLISRRLYGEIGGYRPIPLMEDVDIVRRLGRRRLSLLASRALTSAERYRRDGYALRIARNLGCLALYQAGVAPARIARYYERGRGR